MRAAAKDAMDALLADTKAAGGVVKRPRLEPTPAGAFRVGIKKPERILRLWKWWWSRGLGYNPFSQRMGNDEDEWGRIRVFVREVIDGSPEKRIELPDR